MNKISNLFIAIILFQISLFAQNIKFKITNSPPKANLFQLEGEKATKIDSVNFKNGSFQFNLNGKHNGFYRLQFDTKHILTFINDGKDVEIVSDYKNLKENLEITNSESNKLYFEFIELNKSFKTKSELLNIILTNYPKDDNYYEITKSKLLKVQSEYQKFINVTSQTNNKSFIARYIKSAQLPVVGISIPQNLQIEFLKKHALDNVDFNDTEMIYSDLYANKSIEYLSYYKNQRLPKELLEQEFMKAVDTLLNRAKINELVYQYMTEYLVEGFTKFGFDAIINYIVDNYVIKDDLCLDAKVESTIQKRIDQSKNFKIGKTIPNIILADIDGNKIDLSEIKSEKVLVLFYASWCPHCKKTITELIKLYNKQKTKNIEILAISLDDKKADWLKIVKDYKLNWLNVSDLKGWSGKTTTDFYIYATPTMFLVDKNRKIISKPMTISDVHKLFSVL